MSPEATEERPFPVSSSGFFSAFRGSNLTALKLAFNRKIISSFYNATKHLDSWRMIRDDY
jgi:hypothetical protein